MATPSTMQAMIKETEVEGYTLKEITTPEPQGDEVLIQVDAVSICGSDIALYKWNETAKVGWGSRREQGGSREGAAGEPSSTRLNPGHNGQTRVQASCR